VQTVFEGRKKSFFRYRGLQHVDPQHPPHKEYRDDCAGNVNNPVAKCFRFAEIEHEGIVARGIKQAAAFAASSAYDRIAFA
jgi:hypothetical protein